MNWRFVFLVAIVAAAIAATAQPRSQSGAAIPRLADGKPDFNGVWDHPRVMDISKSNPGDACASNTKGCKQVGAGDLPFTPLGLEKFQHHEQETAQFDPGAHCLPWGLVRSWGTPFPAEIFQTPKRVAVLFEMNNTFHVIPTDGRAIPKDPDPTWMGTSAGKWDGDTLVVDSLGFNGKTWLDTAEHPSSDALHVIERLRLLDADHLSYEMTVEDPKIYTKPIKNSRVFARMKPGQELMEYSCEENNKELIEGHEK
jgi:hypothetical protein